MKLSERKQLDTIILEEVNVENYDREFGVSSETGKVLKLRFNGEEYFWMVGDERIEVKNMSATLRLIDEL